MWGIQSQTSDGVQSISDVGSVNYTDIPMFYYVNSGILMLDRDRAPKLYVQFFPRYFPTYRWCWISVWYDVMEIEAQEHVFELRLGVERGYLVKKTNGDNYIFHPWMMKDIERKFSCNTGSISHFIVWRPMPDSEILARIILPSLANWFFYCYYMWWSASPPEIATASGVKTATNSRRRNKE